MVHGVIWSTGQYSSQGDVVLVISSTAYHGLWEDMVHGATWFMGRHGTRGDMLHVAKWFMGRHDSQGHMVHGVM